MPKRDVLVVDDVPEILELFRTLLRRVRSFDIDLALEVDSARALDLVARRPFDLVVNDFRMRQVDGIEVLRAARAANPEGRRVLMTGYNEVPASMDRIRSAAIDAYVQKPLKSQELLLLVRDLLSGDEGAIEAAHADAREVEASASMDRATGRAG